MAEDVSLGRGSKLMDWRKPLDINTIIVVLVFIGGGVMFVADTRAGMDDMRRQFGTVERSVEHLSDRIDRIVEGQTARK